MARAKVVPQARGHIKKDDFVKIIAGKDRGKQGKVLRVFPQEGRLTVERVNMVKRHTRPTRQMQQGGIIEREGKLQSQTSCLFVVSVSVVYALDTKS